MDDMPKATGPTTTDTSTTRSASGMMEMGSGTCKVSMLWNWYTVDACFLSSSWHVSSQAMFAGSCIGIVLLVIVMEALRRVGKEYDRYIVRRHSFGNSLEKLKKRSELFLGGGNKSMRSRENENTTSMARLFPNKGAAIKSGSFSTQGGQGPRDRSCAIEGDVKITPGVEAGHIAMDGTVVGGLGLAGIKKPFRPNVAQQAVRALFHMLQFAVAYLIMLLAMHSNGYILICIFIGAYLGAFIFQWDFISSSSDSSRGFVSDEPTVCCG